MHSKIRKQRCLLGAFGCRQQRLVVKESWYKSLVKNAKITENKNDQCNHATNLPLKIRSQQKQKRSMESCYKSFVKNGKVNKNKNDQSSQKITSKPHTKAPQCHGLPATRFQRVQNPEPNKLHNASKSCSRQNTSTKITLSRDLTIRR